MKFADLPTLGQPLAAGIFAGLITTKDGAHCAIVLLADKPSKRLDFNAANAWAAELGDGAALPTRPVSALLFANCKSEFEEAWHWTSEAYSDAYAWFQGFYGGSQDFSYRSYEGWARAVRLIQLDGSNNANPQS